MLKLRLLQADQVNTENIQCFVADSTECTLQFNENSHVISMVSNHQFQQRRTLYTITAPSASIPGGWYWFSHLWIEPSLQ